MIDEGALTLFLLITARMSGFVGFNPLLSRQNFPAAFKSGFVLVLSAFTYSVVGGRVEPPAGVLPLAAALLLEVGVGLILGFVVHFFLYIPQMAGLAIDTQMGMTMSQIYDSGSQSNMSVTGTLLNTLMVLLFSPAAAITRCCGLSSPPARLWATATCPWGTRFPIWRWSCLWSAPCWR